MLRVPFPIATAVALGFAVISVQGCASGGANQKKATDDSEGVIEDPDNPGALSAERGEMLPSVTFAEGAEQNWKLGEEAFADEDYLAAQRFYSFIRTKYPYSQFAALADLRIGDCQFARGRFIEAVDSYQNFVRLHPTHERVPYALYRTGLSYYEQIPGDWFLMPPSEEKEQSAVRDAERALTDYVERFPKDDNFTDGKKLLVDVRKRLMAHERYVANFYKNLGKDRAYVGRLQVIRTKFPDVGLDDALFVEIVGAYVRLGELKDAQATLKDLEKAFPGSPRLAEARALVANAGPSPALVPAKTSSTAAVSAPRES
ncbi:outer membrane protein assembly factor BamD [Myxococcota bacterium]|nr:outer membrane protein assembly factor BamD [Myxococcota bacterium]